MLVFVVDDDNGQRMTLKIMLSKNGYQVDTAEDGYDVVKAANNVSYDVIPLDGSIPNKTGLEATLCRGGCKRTLDDPEMPKNTWHCTLSTLTAARLIRSYRRNSRLLYLVRLYLVRLYLIVFGVCTCSHDGCHSFLCFAFGSEVFQKSR